MDPNHVWNGTLWKTHRFKAAVTVYYKQLLRSTQVSKRFIFKIQHPTFTAFKLTHPGSADTISFTPSKEFGLKILTYLH